tara:strand:+ start:107 stop:760 length:654 start_codon:yes stop_codon:yes gene_type:complete
MITKPYNPNIQVQDGCFVCDRDRYMLIHIYKNASISLRNTLGMWTYKNYTHLEPDNYIKICVLRNPLYRCISIYQYILRLENGESPYHPAELIKQTEFYKIRNKPIESFNSFLRAIDGGNFFDAVAQPQIKFLRDKSLPISKVSNFLIQENIDNDFKKFCFEHQIENVQITHDNRSDDKVKETLTKYVDIDPIARDKILDIYSEDKDLYETIAKVKI